LAVALTISGSAHAQIAEPTATGTLEEVVVTAQKRSENVRDVPLSITALTNNQLDAAGVSTTMDLTTLVPGLKMDRVGGFTDPAIRGITTYITSAGVDPNVATYIDGVYQSNPEGGTFDLPDVERIEVLKGPQGTLFGRNATGGAIQVFTKDPSFTPTGSVSVSYGNYNDQSAKAYVSGSIIDGKLAASLAASEETADSYYHNLTPNVPLEGVDSNFVRGKLLFKPTDDLKFVLQGYYGHHGDPSAVEATPYHGISFAQAIPGAIVPTKPYDVAENITPKQHVLSAGVNLHITADTPLGIVNAIGAYNHSNSVGVVPALNGAVPAPYRGGYYFSTVPDDAESGEIDLASPQYGKFSYVAGLYYYSDTNAWDPLRILENLPIAAASYQVSIFGRETSRAWAAYTETTYKFTDDWSAILGIRYSNEVRGLSGESRLGPYDKIPGPWWNFGRKVFVGITPRVSVKYQMTPDTNTYFTYSSGFKSGTFSSANIPYAPTSDPQPYVKPEHVDAFELGAKSAPANWLHLDAALFWYDYTNQQVTANEIVCLPLPGGGTQCAALAVDLNAAASVIKGAEVNFDAKVTPEFRVRGGVSLLQARFSNFPNAQVLVAAPGNAGLALLNPKGLNVAGRSLPRAPDQTFTLSGTYTKHFEPGTLALTGNLYASSRLYYDDGNVFSQAPYVTLGLNATFMPEAIPNLSISLWGKNITDETTVLGTFFPATTAAFSYAAPATFGVTVAYDF
jgi:iron complex outermembrane receptor protein